MARNRGRLGDTPRIVLVDDRAQLVNLDRVVLHFLFQELVWPCLERGTMS